MNIVAITGRVGKAPKVGNGVANFRLAVGSGERTEWHSVACFNGVSEAAAKLWKGAKVNITGYLKVNTFEGTSRVEIVATFIETLSAKPAAPAPETEAEMEAETPA
jgi:single-stranded DNA-binding protein